MNLARLDLGGQAPQPARVDEHDPRPLTGCVSRRRTDLSEHEASLRVWLPGKEWDRRCRLRAQELGVGDRAGNPVEVGVLPRRHEQGRRHGQPRMNPRVT